MHSAQLRLVRFQKLAHAAMQTLGLGHTQSVVEHLAQQAVAKLKYCWLLWNRPNQLRTNCKLQFNLKLIDGLVGNCQQLCQQW